MARSGNWLFAWFDGVNSSLTVTKKHFLAFLSPMVRICSSMHVSSCHLDLPLWTGLVYGFNRSSDCPLRSEAISQWVMKNRMFLSDVVHLMLAQAFLYRGCGLCSQP